MVAVMAVPDRCGLGGLPQTPMSAHDSRSAWDADWRQLSVIVPPRNHITNSPSHASDWEGEFGKEGSKPLALLNFTPSSCGAVQAAVEGEEGAVGGDG